MGGQKIIPMSELRNHKGFTLVEIMIAIFILVIALLGLVSVTVMVIKGNSFSKTMTTATTLAKDKMEQLKNLSYDNTSLTGDTSSAGLQHDDAGNPLETIYTRQWWVRKDYPATDMKTITLSVSWSWQDASRQVELKTIMAK